MKYLFYILFLAGVCVSCSNGEESKEKSASNNDHPKKVNPIFIL